MLAAEAAYVEAYGEPPTGAQAVPEAPPLGASSPAQLVAAAPALREAAAALEGAQREHEATVARGRPSVALEAQVTRRDLSGAGPPGTDNSVAVVVRHAFYTGGATQARNDQAWAKVEQAERDMDVVRRQLERLAAQALAEAGEGEALVQARRAAAVAASRSLLAVREQFAFNRGSLLDLMRAQDELHATGTALVDAQAERAAARWRLLHLAGVLGHAIGLPVPQDAPHP